MIRYMLNCSNYYQILGINKDATADEIRQKYKELALKYHPDKNKQGSSEAFKNIVDAYNTLSDPYKRGKYDAMLEGNNFGDNFDKIFNAPFFRMPFPSMSSFNKGKVYTKSYEEIITKTRDSSGTTVNRRTKLTENGKHKTHQEKYHIDNKGRKQIIKDGNNKKYYLKR